MERTMETIPSPGRKPNDGPGNPDYPGDDVREPPLPEARPKEDLPGKDDLIDPGEGGGRIKKGGASRQGGLSCEKLLNHKNPSTSMRSGRRPDSSVALT
jgi:hypothetical protein